MDRPEQPTNGSRVARGPKREMLSRGDNLPLRATLRRRLSDTQWGFKAIRADATVAVLERIAAQRGAPELIRMDNGRVQHDPTAQQPGPVEPG